MLKPTEIRKIDFAYKSVPPKQKVFKTPLGTMLVFPSGKFRLMGVKEALTLTSAITNQLPYHVESLQLQSATYVDYFGQEISLQNLAHQLTSQRAYYEPEIFPALRLLDYRPICVNVFASGKLVITGFKELDYYKKFISKVKFDIFDALCDYYFSLM